MDKSSSLRAQGVNVLVNVRRWHTTGGTYDSLSPPIGTTSDIARRDSMRRIVRPDING